MKRIGILRVLKKKTAEGTRGFSAGESDLLIRLDVFDTKSGTILSSENVTFSPDFKKTISDKGIDDFFLDLPLDILGFRILKLPFSDKKKIAEIVPFELQGLILERIDDIVFDSVSLGKDGDGFKILVCYIEKKRFAQILESLSVSGIEPSTAGSLAIGSLLKELSYNPGVAQRLVDLARNPTDWTHTTLSAFEKEELLNPTFNFRTGPFAFIGKASRLSKTLRMTVFFLFAIAMVVNFDLSVKIIKAKKDISAIKNEIRTSYLRLFPTEKKITDEVYQLKIHLKELNDIRDLTRGIPTINFLLNISRIRPQGIVLYEIGLTTEGFTLRGEANSMEEIDKFKKALSDIVDSVNVSDLKPSTGGRFNFTISGRARG